MGVTSLVTRPHVVKNDHGLLVHETINSAASFYEFMNDFMNWAGFFNADSDVIIWC